MSDILPGIQKPGEKPPFPGQPGMDVNDLFKNVMAGSGQRHPLTSAPFAGVNPGTNPQQPSPPPPPKTKNDLFEPSILVEAQKTFMNQPNSQPHPNAGNPDSSGTASAMIPPGWSSQSSQSKRH